MAIRSPTEPFGARFTAWQLASITVPLEFARVNLPIIAITMLVGLVVLVGEIYIMRTDAPYDAQ